MGRYLNPGWEEFKRKTSESIYVDKTGMIARLSQRINRGEKYLCLSAPEGFGKTLTCQMLCAYYSKDPKGEAREVFAPLGVSQDPSFEEKLGKFNVIYVDWGREYQRESQVGYQTESQMGIQTESQMGIQTDFQKGDQEGMICRVTEKIKGELRRGFPGVDLEEEDSLGMSMLKIYSKTGETFVILMDEYDVFARQAPGTKLLDRYLRLLSALFKSSTLSPAISLAFLTGVLPPVRDQCLGRAPVFCEYTCFAPHDLRGFVGFTGKEAEELCQRAQLDMEKCHEWYGGYLSGGEEIYRPGSLMAAIRGEGKGGGTTCLPGDMKRLLEETDGMKEAARRLLSGEAVEVDVTHYLNTYDGRFTKSDVLTLLIYLGYLAYDFREETCRIPNREAYQWWEGLDI